MQAPAGAFAPFEQQKGLNSGTQPPVSPDNSQQAVSALTVSIVPTFKRCSDQYQFSAKPVLPVRVLTNPSDPAVIGGHDNINDDLIVSVNDVFISSLGTRYIVRDTLGQGTFGQVFKCSNQSSGEMVAIKIIKNQTAYYHQARVEIGILQFLNTKADPTDCHHIVRLKDFFLHKSHLCLVFELLNLNLFELIRHNKFRGLSLSLVRVFTKQMLEALVVLRDSGIIHCDIKPENILLSDSTSGDVKLIDFGSACFANRTVYSYIQSRFYRSPEVVLGHGYTMAVDMWSLGCVIAELFLGLPLFPAACEHDLLGRILQMMGSLPEKLLREGKNTSKYFSRRPGMMGVGAHSYALLTAEEFETVNGRRAPRGKQYFQHTALADIINAYPLKSRLSEEEVIREIYSREAFTDFLLGMLDVDAETRWSPRQAQQHPFITGAPFRAPFQPVSDSSMPSIGVIKTGGVQVAAAASAPGIPMMIPQPRPQEVAANNWAAMLASSPQVHAQAHAAAMAAVHMQMSLSQQNQAAFGTSYSAAHSLQRIVGPSPIAAAQACAFPSSHRQGHGQAGPSLGSSLPAPMFSPPSRSFGVHLQAALQDMPTPSFEGGDRQHIMPLLQLPTATTATTTAENAITNQMAFQPSSFQPSSVSTFHSAMAKAAALSAARKTEPSMSLSSPSGSGAPAIDGGAQAPPSEVQSATELGSGGSKWSDQQWPAPAITGQQSVESVPSAAGETPQKFERSVSAQEEIPNPADWDPLWSDDLLKEDDASPPQQQKQPQPQVGIKESLREQPAAIAPVAEILLSAVDLRLSSPPVPGSRQDTDLSLAAECLSQLHSLRSSEVDPATNMVHAGATGKSTFAWSAPQSVPQPAAMPSTLEVVAPPSASQQEPLQTLTGFHIVNQEEDEAADT